MNAEDSIILNAFDAEAYRNGKQLDEDRKDEMLRQWKRLRDTLPEDEAFRQVTKFLRPCTP